jgi:hypothetical protein
MPNLAGVLEATCHCPAVRPRHQTCIRAHQTKIPSTSDASGTHDRFSRRHHGAATRHINLYEPRATPIAELLEQELASVGSPALNTLIGAPMYEL